MSSQRSGPSSPREIYDYLDQHVAGQEKAKKVLSVAMYNHYKRISLNEARKQKSGHLRADEQILIEKSNILLYGPSGSGKTHLVKTIASFLDLPFAICDCANITQAGYKGGDIQDVFPNLLSAARNDVEKAQSGIVFLDEVDKIAARDTFGCQDIGGRGAQEAMLKIVEGTAVDVRGTRIDTTNILFVAAGAFVDLDKIVAKRESREIPSGDTPKGGKTGRGTRFANAEARDLIEFGMMPEFVGRFPVISALQQPSVEVLMQILDKSVLAQYRMSMKMDGCELTVDNAVRRTIAARAFDSGTGVRALRGILEGVLLGPLFKVPNSDIIGVRIQNGAVEGEFAVSYTRKALVWD